MLKKKDSMKDFLHCSALLTGFGRLDLIGTGMSELYRDTLLETIGEEICSELWTKIAGLESSHLDDPDKVEEAISKHILVADRKLGPVAKSIIQMWYLGQWTQTPIAWREEFGTNPNDFNRVISAAAYTEGLVWRAAGTHPQGAKQPGYGTWSAPPVQIAIRDATSAREAGATE
ncbi:MAG: hypothetical protein JO307_02800 [Bryobacterales bacterium]|nr:hypothetical protein [Bryobacterales bacterium]MBV9398293.1 hypothetical protein [Bryobacterales bacterium]